MGVGVSDEDGMDEDGHACVCHGSLWSVSCVCLCHNNGKWKTSVIDVDKKSNMSLPQW